jgi:hypothetical protein
VHAGVLIVPHTASNRAPGRIATSLRRWNERVSDPVPYFIDFLKV